MQTRSHRLSILTALAALLGALLPVANAQPRAPEGALEMRAVAERSTAAQGETIVVAIEMVFGVEVTESSTFGGPPTKVEYHAWPNVIPTPEDFDYAPDIIDLGLEDFRPTVLLAAESDVFSIGAGLWPQFDVVEGLPSYHKTIVVYVPVTIAQDAPLGDLEIPLTIATQICVGNIVDGGMCFPPTDYTTSTSVTVVDDPAVAAAASMNEPTLFADVDRASVLATSDIVIPVDATNGDATTTTPEEQGATEAASGGSGAQFFGFDIGSGVVLIALFGAIGGFILNLTPCVLPVIPIKIMALSQHAGGSRSRTFFLGFMMSIGVVAFWAALAIPVVTLQNFADPSRIFGIWWLTAGIGVIIAVMSLGLMGMFQFNLPKQAYMVNPKADTAWGSFLFGIMTAVLGLPCFGFVAGALVPAASTQGPIVVVALFTSMGVGMALPYFVLSAFPGLIEKVPRTGPASELVKQVMGLALLAAAAWFIGAGVNTLAASNPYIGGQLHMWVTGAMLFLAGIWLILRTIKISKKPFYLGVAGLFALILAGGGAFIAARFTLDAKEDYTTKKASEQQAFEQSEAEIQSINSRILAKLSQIDAKIDLLSEDDASTEILEITEAVRKDLADLETARSAGAIITSTWIDYSPEIVQRAIDEGYIVALDFTADWCINCKALEKGVLNVGEARKQLRGEDVVMVKADLSDTNAPGWKALEELNQTGIPTLAIWSKGNEDDQWIRNAYDNASVVDAIEAAREASDRDRGDS